MDGQTPTAILTFIIFKSPGYRMPAAIDEQLRAAEARRRCSGQCPPSDTVMPEGINGGVLKDRVRQARRGPRVSLTMHGRLRDGSIVQAKPYRKAELRVDCRNLRCKNVGHHRGIAEIGKARVGQAK
jgi:hypothetical protein